MSRRRSVKIPFVLGLLLLLAIASCVAAPPPSEVVEQSAQPVAWLSTGSPGGMRRGNTATLLASGKVLVTGGYDQPSAGTTVYLASASLYDPSTGAWTPTAPMSTVRARHTATLLPSGKVLVAGGTDGGLHSYFSSAEIYDPATGTWTPAASMTAHRMKHAAVLLPNGKVLVVGGFGASQMLGPMNIVYFGHKSAEIYDPSANAWSPAASLPLARDLASATLLPNGKVLVAGGVEDGYVNGGYDYTPLATSTLYDPALDSWSAVQTMPAPAISPRATSLASGKVLVTGGYLGSGPSSVPQAKAQLYDPASDTWLAAASPATARYDQVAALLPSGAVLIAGGTDGTDTPLKSAEIYDPAADAWQPAGSMHLPRTDAGAAVLAGGKILVTYGFFEIDAGADAAQGAEIFDPTYPAGTPCSSNAQCATGFCADGVCCDTACAAGVCDACSIAAGATQDGVCTPLAEGAVCPVGICQQAACATGITWFPSGTLAVGRGVPASLLLGNGELLTTGGYAGYFPDSVLASTERYDPLTQTWKPAGTMLAARGQHTATLLPDGRVLAVGGFDNRAQNAADLASAELYDPLTDTWTATGAMSTPRAFHTATLLASGKVLVTGGYKDNFKAGETSAELYDPATGTWSSAGNMASHHAVHSAVLLPNGKVLVAGGYFSGTLLGCDLYDPATNTWAAAAPMAEAHQAAVVLPNGKVLASGGFFAGIYLATAQLYNPATNTWSPAAQMSHARTFHSAVLLDDGKVLVTGGTDGSNGGFSDLASSELYDPATDTWTDTVPLVLPRESFSLVKLTNGEVMAIGGDVVLPYHQLATATLAERYRPSLGAGGPPGAPCASPSDCASDVCAGGVCCGGPCADACQGGVCGSSSSGAGGGASSGSSASSSASSGTGGAASSSSASSGAGGAASSSSASSGAGGGMGGSTSSGAPSGSSSSGASSGGAAGSGGGGPALGGGGSGCGCSTTGSSLGGAPWLALSLLALARRRPRPSPGRGYPGSIAASCRGLALFSRARRLNPRHRRRLCRGRRSS